MVSFLRSKNFVRCVWLSIVPIWFLVYLVGFASTGLDRASYNQGEKVQTIGLSYYWETTFGGNAVPFPEAFIMKTKYGRTLSPEEMVEFINPELNPFVEDGKVFYISMKERTEWGEKIYWAPANFATTGIARLLNFIR